MFWRKSKINDIPLGIAWEKNDLLVVELKRNRHGFLAETAKAPIAKGFSGEEDLGNAECLISSLKELKEERGWYRKKVVAAFPGRKAPLRYFRVPDMPSKELKLAVEWEAKQLFGFTKKEYCFDYVILTEKNRETPTSKEVLLAAIPKDFALKLYHTFLEGGFILEAIDVAPLAFARALSNNAPLIDGEEEGNATLFLDLGTCFTQLVFFSDQQIIFARTIGFVCLNTSSSAEDLAKEIKRTLSYLKTNAREIQLKEIVAGGVGSDWQGLNQLESALAIPIKKGIPGLGYLEEPYPENIYTTALGLALKGVVRNVY